MTFAVMITTRNRREEVRRTLGLPLDVEVGGAVVVHVPPDDFLASRKGSRADDFRQQRDGELERFDRRYLLRARHTRYRQRDASGGHQCHDRHVVHR